VLPCTEGQQKGEVTLKISFIEDEKNIIFRVDDPGKYKNVLRNCFYEADGDSYIKKFPKDIENIIHIKDYYLKTAEKMFSQLGYYSPIPWQDALIWFIDKIKNTNIDWWLTGSCVLGLRGINITPHDVDIMLNSKDLVKFKNIFNDYLIEPIIDTNGWVTKYFGVIFNFARIDIAFDPQDLIDDPEPSDAGPFAMNNLEKIIWKGHVIKVPPIHLQLKVNQRRGRIDRVKAIEKYIKAENG
jgi:hypothetical protein